MRPHFLHELLAVRAARALAAFAFASASFLLAQGCDISTNEEPKDLSVRSSTCLTYQDSICDFLVDRCNLVTSRTDCDNDYRARFCQDDAVVESCLDALPSATCDGVPAPCQSVNNTQPAIDDCNSIVALFCQQEETCTIMSQSECIAQSAVTLDCSKAVGITSGASACQAAIKAAPCETANVLPAACTNVVHLSQ